MSKITKLKSGRWQLDYTNSAGKRTRRNFAKQKEAAAAKLEIDSKIARGVDRPLGDDMRTGDALDLYLARLEARKELGEVTPKHIATIRGHINSWLKNEIFGIHAVRLRHLTTGVIAEFRDDLRSKTNLSVVTVRKIISTLHSCLEFAKERDLIGNNPSHGLKVESKRLEQPKTVVPPEKKALKAILAATEGPPMKSGSAFEKRRKRNEQLLQTAIMFAASSGLRAGEQWALRWKDINFAGKTVTVSKRIDAYGIEGPPKSKAGFREVPLSDHVLNALRRWRLRSGYAAADDFVFANHVGKHTCHDNLTDRHWKPCLKRAEVEHFGWHSLRHFAVSCWIENGLDLKEVSTLAGHSSITITADRYGHMFPNGSRQENMNAIAADIFG